MARMLLSSGLIILAGSPVTVRAGAWSIAAQTQVGSGYDDNISLSSVQPVGAWNGTADLGAALQFQDNAFALSVAPRVLAVRYAGQSLLNRTEAYLSLSTRASRETGSTSFALSGAQDTTLTSELGLTGLSNVNKKHRSFTGTLSNNWTITERVDTNLQLAANANRYVDAQGTGLVDYNYGSVELGVGYDWTERSRWSLRASAGQLQVPDATLLNKTNLSLTLGYGAQLAPRWRADVLFGPSQVRDSSGSSSGTVYNATLSRHSETMDLNLTAARDITPTGRGVLSRREQLRLTYTRSWDERWANSWSASATRNRNLLAQGGFDQQQVTYADLTGSLSWRMTPTWSLSVAGGYARQTIGSGLPSAARRHASLNVSWNGLRHDLH